MIRSHECLSQNIQNKILHTNCKLSNNEVRASSAMQKSQDALNTPTPSIHLTGYTHTLDIWYCRFCHGTRRPQLSYPIHIIGNCNFRLRLRLSVGSALCIPPQCGTITSHTTLDSYFSCVSTISSWLFFSLEFLLEFVAK